MAKDYSTGLKLENEVAESTDYPVVRKKFRVTIDVEATLAAGPQGEVLPPLRRTSPTPKHLWSDCWPNPGL
jgi:hypothetical protein